MKQKYSAIRSISRHFWLKLTKRVPWDQVESFSASPNDAIGKRGNVLFVIGLPVNQF